MHAATSRSTQAAEFDDFYAGSASRVLRRLFLITGDAGEAEDITQEAFLRALRALDRFDRTRPFAPWLHRIVVNRAIDWSRARALRHEQLGPVPEAFTAAPPAPDGEGLDDALMAALAALGPEQRAVVVLRHVLDRSPGEIARLLDVPRGTVNSRLRRALDTLADALGERP